MASGSTAMLRRAAQDCLSQASAEHFQQCAEFALLRNRGFGSLAVTVLPIPLARRAAAAACAAVQSTAALFRRWRPAGLPTLGPRSAPTGCLKLHGLLVSLRAFSGFRASVINPFQGQGLIIEDAHEG
jgi:hypothetical protein